jgi:hypothetical protein
MAQHNNMICWVLGQIDVYYDSIMACSNERSHNNKRTRFNIISVTLRSIWRYQRSNQNPYIEEEQTRQWPKQKAQKYKQRSI